MGPIVKPPEKDDSTNFRHCSLLFAVELRSAGAEGPSTPNRSIRHKYYTYNGPPIALGSKTVIFGYLDPLSLSMEQ